MNLIIITHNIVNIIQVKKMMSSVTLTQNASSATDYRNITTISQRRSDINYLQYINFYETQHCNFQYEEVSQQKLQKSLNDLRSLMKQFNELLKKTMHKNYELLAQFSKESPPLDVEKQIQILRAQIENSQKVIAAQEAEKANVAKYCQEIEQKEDYELQLLKQMNIIKSKMPQVQLISKHQIGGIQKNGFVLVNQEEDQTLYIRLAILRADYERNGEKLRKLVDKNEQLDKKITTMEQREYDAAGRLQQLIQIAKQKSLDVSTNSDMVNLKEKHEILKKKRDQEQKKTALFEHVSNTNEANLRKKIADMKKLQKQYMNKSQAIEEKIKKLEEQNEKVLKNEKIIKPQTLPFRYAQTLLKGDKKSVGKKNVVESYNDKNFELKQDNGSAVFSKPNMAIKNKSNNKEIKDVKKDFLFEDEDEYLNKRSHIFNKKKNIGEKDSKKRINASLNEDLFFEQKRDDSKPPQYRISKPVMSLKKKKQRKSELIPDIVQEPEEEIRGFPRLHQRRNIKKISENEMKSLEEKGRKILGI